MIDPRRLSHPSPWPGSSRPSAPARQCVDGRPPPAMSTSARTLYQHGASPRPGWSQPGNRRHTRAPGESGGSVWRRSGVARSVACCWQRGTVRGYFASTVIARCLSRGDVGPPVSGENPGGCPPSWLSRYSRVQENRTHGTEGGEGDLPTPIEQGDRCGGADAAKQEQWEIPRCYQPHRPIGVYLRGPAFICVTIFLNTPARRTDSLQGPYTPSASSVRASTFTSS